MLINNTHLIYLCSKDKFSPYYCNSFESYQKADKYYQSCVKDEDIKTTMIPVCKFIPDFLAEKILQYKISNIFDRVIIHE